MNHKEWLAKRAKEKPWVHRWNGGSAVMLWSEYRPTLQEFTAVLRRPIKYKKHD